MSYAPESTVARPLLALTTQNHPGPRRRGNRRARVILLVGLGVFTVVLGGMYFGPSAGLPIPERFAPYYAQPHTGSDAAHPQPPPGAAKPAPNPNDFPTAADVAASAEKVTAGADAAIDILLASQPSSLPSARSRYSLRTGRNPPRGFDAFYAFAKERGCLVEGYTAVERDFAPFWRAEKTRKGWFRERVRVMEGKLVNDAHGVAALAIRDGKVQRPENGATYFDGDWENTINKFASSLPSLTVLINGRDEPRVVFDVAGLFDDPPTQPPAPTDPNPFALSPPSTGAFFADPVRKDVCRPARGVGVLEDVPFLLSASSAEFTTDLVPVLSMAKTVDASTTVDATAAGMGGGGGSCFADVLVPGEFYYRNSWWAGKFDYPNNIKWEDKKPVLYWRGESNGGHIRGTIYKTFPRFRLIELAALPENQGFLDVRMTGWHESHCTDDCDAEPIKKAYNISGKVVPREDAYKYKYLLDVDGNTFSGRYLGLLRSGGLVFKSTAFTEFFTPWLVPFEHFIPVRPDLSDLMAKIAWARANDAEARRIQEAGRVFAERILTDAQNDCYWFAVMLEWGALWGE
ncbi:glycosyl transferase family 90-domain-containing protein [Mycena alexandri]|uniref:Glycosyl transferase family 90-domain-containing protein n=1 Tax=Mycena alexandri TaxID=1745969 RepID=A0AAD6XB80_9AGAR|nr:glycosyl transferase family 90-domain-containing protein [Mycena alexandri]